MNTPVSLAQLALSQRRVPDDERIRVAALIRRRAELMDQVMGIDDDLSVMVQQYG